MGILRVQHEREGVSRESRLSVVGMRDLREAPHASGRTPWRRSTQFLPRLSVGVKEKTNRRRVVSTRRCGHRNRGPFGTHCEMIVSVSRYAKTKAKPPHQHQGYRLDRGGRSDPWGRWPDSACIGKNDVVSVLRNREQGRKHPIGTTATVASESGFGPSLDPVREIDRGMVPVTV